MSGLLRRIPLYSDKNYKVEKLIIKTKVRAMYRTRYNPLT